MRELRRVASQGIPDAALRPTLWKVPLQINYPFLSFQLNTNYIISLLQLLLGYLPPDRALWFSELTKKRSQYKNFKDDLLMNPVTYLLHTYLHTYLLIPQPHTFECFCA